MIVLAVLLLVLAAAIVVFVVVTGVSEPVVLAWDALNLRWEPTALLVFLAGAVTLLLVVLALGLLRTGTKRKSEQRRELKRLRQVERERGEEPGSRSGHGTAGGSAGSGTRTDAPTREQPSAAPKTGEHGSGWHDDASGRRS